MASSSKKKTTMAKIMRENRLRERRVDKQAKKDARKRASAESPDGLLDPLDATLGGLAPLDATAGESAPLETTPAAPASLEPPAGESPPASVDEPALEQAVQAPATG